MKEINVIHRIQELCAARKWTYYRLAKESDIAYSTLSTMLNKANTPSVPTLYKICNGLQITMSQFFSTEDATALLTDAQRACLASWDALDEISKSKALVYMQGLHDRQD